MDLAVLGVGATGARAARQLISGEGVGGLVLRDADEGALARVGSALGDRAHPEPEAHARSVDASVAVLATPAGTHGEMAADLIRSGTDVVSVADSVEDVRDLLDLGPEAAERGRTVLVGAGFSPGLSCVLAAHAAIEIDEPEEIHLAKAGTGGPACARQHHRALGGHTLDWRSGGWSERRGGSGRELCWFPEPVGGEDCYRAALPEPLLLHAAFPRVDRITARMAANRRDRLTARLPMLRRPHPEGGVGAVRAEVRGLRDGRFVTTVLGAIDRPAVAAGAVAAQAALGVASGELARPGAHGLAGAGLDTAAFLADLADRGVRAARFEGDAVSV